jgi:hypothetical protein
VTQQAEIIEPFSVWTEKLVLLGGALQKRIMKDANPVFRSTAPQTPTSNTAIHAGPSFMLAASKAPAESPH